MSSPDVIEVEVVYVLPDRLEIVKQKLEPGAVVGDALQGSGLLDRYPELDPENSKVGVFGKLAKLGQALRPGDRVEIYRPLIADPKAAKKKKKAEKKEAKAASE